MLILVRLEYKYNKSTVRVQYGLVHRTSTVHTQRPNEDKYTYPRSFKNTNYQSRAALYLDVNTNYGTFPFNST